MVLSRVFAFYQTWEIIKQEKSRCSSVQEQNNTLKKHQKNLTFATSSKGSDSVPLLTSMKENNFNCVPKSGKCMTKITLD